MKKIINLLLLLILTQTVSCQEKNINTMNNTYNREKDYVIFENQPKTCYFIKVNSQKCHYKILLDDFLVYSYNDTYPAYSVRPMLNSKILKSGEQKLSIIVTPQNGERLTRNSDLTIRLLRYSDMSNKADFGGVNTILEWEMPPIDDKNPLPFVKFDTTFKADVPYEMNTINYAIDLTKTNKDVLLKEVVEKYKEYHQYISNDYDKYNQEAKQKILSSVVPNYKTKTELENILAENKKDFENDKYNSTLQPIENYKMVLYGNGRVAALERIKDGGRIIWCKDPKTGEEILSLPLFIYKDNRDKQWHIW